MEKYPRMASTVSSKNTFILDEDFRACLSFRLGKVGFFSVPVLDE